MTLRIAESRHMPGVLFVDFPTPPTPDPVDVTPYVIAVRPGERLGDLTYDDLARMGVGSHEVAHESGDAVRWAGGNGLPVGR